MLVRTGVRSWLMAKLRGVAMFSGPCPVRILQAWLCSRRRAAFLHQLGFWLNFRDVRTLSNSLEGPWVA